MKLILEKDTDLTFPQTVILKASAGSGKTHALTKRFVQFLLSDQIKYQNLNNILAITFSNNATKEMKERILSWLKEVYFKDENKINELLQILSFDRDELIRKSEYLIDEILTHYSDFGVKTIDSFMVSIYKASAIDLGYSPDFEIHMNSQYLMDYAFDLFFRELPDPRILEEVIDSEIRNRQDAQSFPWNPSPLLLQKIKEIYSKLSAIGKRVNIPDVSEGQKIEAGIRNHAYQLDLAIEKSGLERSKVKTFATILTSVKYNRYPNLIGIGISKPPVNKPRKITVEYDDIVTMWEQLGQLIKDYHAFYARAYFAPYLRVYAEFKQILEEVKKKEAVVFIEDVSKNLAAYLGASIVPDVYFRLGETIFHYLIDEFQDTSPLQWNNLFPLIENSLSQGGSLLAVGDTKQSIYGFRNADYRIMRSLEAVNPFPSSYHEVRELTVNYRSFQGICDFNQRVFLETLPHQEQYREAAQRSGLSDYQQDIKSGHEGLGQVELAFLEKDADNPAEKQKVQELIRALKNKGYQYADIAVLTFRNEQVVNVTAWLNELDIPFISYSSLDIRKRKITGEIISLLKFLDSPPDDLSFITFLLGDVFSKAREMDKICLTSDELNAFFFENRKNRPLYKHFQANFSAIWERYFSRLFKTVGYMPLYDLVCEIYRTFNVFQTFHDEQATVIKVLEIIKDFEDTGKNNLRDFIKYTENEENGNSDWDVNIPADIDAVKVMTVHKAKGLGFPVAIVLLYNDTFRGFPQIIQDKGDAVNLLKINGAIADYVPEYGKLYEEEKTKEMVNKLNALYVSFTRAEHELHVIGIGERSKYPLDFLPEYIWAPGSGIQAPGFRLWAFELARSPKPEAHSPVKSYPGLNVIHNQGPETFAAQTVKMINLEERRRGDFIHRALSYIDYIDVDFESSLVEIIEQLNLTLGKSYSITTIQDSLREFLQDREIKEFFVAKPGRIILKEQEFADTNGNLFRMDRVVVDEHLATVIDFKTGQDSGKEAGYILQVRNYLNLLKDIYPDKRTQGIIAYIDLKEIKYI
ncbi:MAG: UvrD-helicase domain-containing protein [Candidatus Schekmanbacteria bacterium]|nr:UvrD-helicase domain-containing protein [Candidatus Schekmanbacteria bacterium]